MRRHRVDQFRRAAAELADAHIQRDRLVGAVDCLSGAVPVAENDVEERHKSVRVAGRNGGTVEIDRDILYLGIALGREAGALNEEDTGAVMEADVGEVDIVPVGCNAENRILALRILALIGRIALEDDVVEFGIAAERQADIFVHKPVISINGAGKAEIEAVVRIAVCVRRAAEGNLPFPLRQDNALCNGVAVLQEDRAARLRQAPDRLLKRQNRSRLGAEICIAAGVVEIYRRQLALRRQQRLIAVAADERIGAFGTLLPNERARMLACILFTASRARAVHKIMLMRRCEYGACICNGPCLAVCKPREEFLVLGKCRCRRDRSRLRVSRPVAVVSILDDRSARNAEDGQTVLCRADRTRIVDTVDINDIFRVFQIADDAACIHAAGCNTAGVHAVRHLDDMRAGRQIRGTDIRRLTENAAGTGFTVDSLRIETAGDRHRDAAAVNRRADDAADTVVSIVCAGSAGTADYTVVDAAHDLHREAGLVRRRLKSADDTACMDNAADSAVVDAVLDGDARVLRDAENTACAAGCGMRAGNRAIVDTVFNHEVAADHRADNTRNTAAGARNLTSDGDVLDRDTARRIADKTPTVGCRSGLDVEPLDLGVGFAVCLLDTDEAARESSGGIADRSLIGLAGHVDIILKNDILAPEGRVAHQRFQVCRTCEIDLAVRRRCKRGGSQHEREHDQQQAKRQRQA